MSRLSTCAAVLSLTLGATTLGLGLPSASAATFDVTVGTDDAASPTPGSLRWAIEQANANPGQDVISIAPGLTINLLDSVNVMAGTDIVGDASSPATIQLTAPAYFDVDTPMDDEQFSLQHLTIGGQVRMLHAPKNVLIDDSNFLAGGGENRFQTNGTMTVRNSTFTGTFDSFNSLSTDCNEANIAITDSTFDGGDYVQFETDCDVRLERVSISDREGGTIVRARDVDVIDSTFADNLGRGMTLYESRAVTVTGSTFENNRGGLEFTNNTDGPVTIERSVFRRNATDGEGGALLLPLFDDADSLTVTDSVFAENSAATQGGAIFIDSADLSEPDAPPAVTILRSTFSGNRATAGKSLYLGEVEGSAPSASPVVRITNSTFNEPEDPAISGDPQAALEAGTGSVIFGFEETEERPALWLEHSTIVGGGITMPFTGDSTSVRITNSVIDSGPFAALVLLGDEDERPQVQGEGNYATRPGSLAPVATVATRAQLALAPLANNGGVTPTRLPGAASVLIDAGVASAITNDQRLVARDSRPDVGAVEVRVPTLSIQPLVEVDEGAPGRFTVTVSGPADHPGSVRVSTHDNTAVAGTDYTALDTVLSWPAGTANVTRTVEVPTLTRPGAQGGRDLTVRLSDAVAGRVDAAQGRLLIRDSATTTPSPTTPTTAPTETGTPSPDTGVDDDHTTFPTDAPSSGDLPDTGSTVGPWAVLAGLALLLTGAIITLFARRRRHAH